LENTAPDERGARAQKGRIEGARKVKWASGGLGATEVPRRIANVLGSILKHPFYVVIALNMGWDEARTEHGIVQVAEGVGPARPDLGGRRANWFQRFLGFVGRMVRIEQDSLLLHPQCFMIGCE
jgi:hypothetical protein